MRRQPASRFDAGLRGYVLLPVIFALTVIGAVAFLASSHGSASASLAGRELAAEQTRYLAEAAYNAAKWQLSQNSSCSAYTDIASTEFGEHSYSATLTPKSGSPISIIATGLHASGATQNIVRDDVVALEAPVSMLLNPHAEDGSDTYITNSPDNAAFGALPYMQVTGGAVTSNALLKFDLSAISPTAKVISAVLELHRSDAAGSGGTIDVVRVKRGWSEGSGTGANGIPNWQERRDGYWRVWHKSGGDFADDVNASTIVADATTGWFGWDITALVQQWTNGVFANKGMALVAAPGESLQVSFDSSDATDARLHPKLTIVYSCECGDGTPASDKLTTRRDGQDATLDETQPTLNSGTADKLFVADAAGGRQHALLEFNTDYIPRGAKIDSATLTLRAVTSSAKGTVSVHAVSERWDDINASWNIATGSTPWSTPGAAFDPIPSDSVYITGNSKHTLNVTDIVRDNIQYSNANFGFLLKAAANVEVGFGSGDNNYSAWRPSLSISYRCPCGAECDAGTSITASVKVLFVVGDAALLTDTERAYLTLIDDWQFSFQVIDDDAPQTVFDELGITSEVALVTAEIDPATLGNKLVEAKIGAVIVGNDLMAEFGLADTLSWGNGSSIEVYDNSHYLTARFQPGSLPVTSAPTPHGFLVGNLAPGLELLAGSPAGYGVVAVESGGSLNNGASASGRRALLPWGGSSFNPATLTANGQTLLKRALEWGAARPGLGKEILLVVDNPALLYQKQSDKRDVIESFGHAVSLIAAAESMARFNDAATKVDAVYIGELGNQALYDLGFKADLLPTGVISEDPWTPLKLSNYLFSPSQLSDQITILDNSHFITDSLALGPVTTATSNQSHYMISTTRSPDLQVLAALPNGAGTLGAMEKDGALQGGGTAPARRVVLPWFAYGFDVNQMTEDSRLIMYRAIDWVTNAAADAIFGFDTVFDSSRRRVRRRQIATLASLPDSGSLTRISVYVSGEANDIRVAVYDDTGGAPGTLQVESDVYRAPGSAGWVEIPVAHTPLAAGDYWLALSFSSGNQRYYYEAGGQSRENGTNAVANGFSANWGIPSASGDARIAIYGTYTPAD